MKSLLFTALTISYFTACKAPTYHYVPTMVNAIPYAAAGEGQLGLAFGSVGLALKGGVALAQNININGFIGGIPAADDSYQNTESELSLGVQTNPQNNTVAGFYLGLGMGKNEKDKIGLTGNYNRPFLQAQFAAFDKPIFNTGARLDAYIGLRANYLFYNGRLKGNEFDDDLIYYEPYFGFAVGGQNLRFELLQGLAMKNSGEWGDGVRVFPYFGSIGVVVKIRKAKAPKLQQ
ncbi:hypothetical protein D3H65_02890 [Paraflavitalea soli]|uniref:Outer membrane protein beta-barrel domain-containing protein n=1 Tax=Paraflavitalea soli TaxID=2315862 RepID=A0A3B7MIU4_9BACT|nr:hypothetical protein [Paraflavitalea soli]AXY72976.1 hypothetical protein D3H65_02890 [Paraflavitalea soli]